MKHETIFNFSYRIKFINIILIVLAILTALIVIAFGEKGAGSGLLIYLVFVALVLKAISFLTFLTISKLFKTRAINDQGEPSNSFLLTSSIYDFIFTIILILGIIVAIKYRLLPFI